MLFFFREMQTHLPSYTSNDPADTEIDYIKNNDDSCAYFKLLLYLKNPKCLYNDF